VLLVLEHVKLLVAKYGTTTPSAWRTMKMKTNVSIVRVQLLLWQGIRHIRGPLKAKDFLVQCWSQNRMWSTGVATIRTPVALGYLVQSAWLVGYDDRWHSRYQQLRHYRKIRCRAWACISLNHVWVWI
jgi:hypothetical protein